MDDAYQTFFMEHRVEQDKHQPTAINVHAVEDNLDHDATNGAMVICRMHLCCVSLGRVTLLWRLTHNDAYVACHLCRV